MRRRDQEATDASPVRALPGGEDLAVVEVQDDVDALRDAEAVAQDLDPPRQQVVVVGDPPERDPLAEVGRSRHFWPSWKAAPKTGSIPVAEFTRVESGYPAVNNAASSLARDSSSLSKGASSDICGPSGWRQCTPTSQPGVPPM